MKRNIIIAAVVVFIVAGVWWLRRGGGEEEEEPELATVEVTRGDLRVTVSATGVLEPLTTVEVKSRSGGEISALYVEAGDYVEAGQLIAQLDPTELQSEVDQAAAQVVSANARVAQARYSAEAQEMQTRTSIEEARASVQTARARLEQAEAQLEQTRSTTQQQVEQAQAGLRTARARLAQAELQAEAEPELVAASVAQAEANLERARQALAALEAGARPQEIAQAEARVTEARVAAENAATELQRQQRLAEKGFVSQQAVDSAQRAADTAAAQLDAAREALSLIREGARSEDIESARAQVRQAEAALEAARTQGISVTVRETDLTAARSAVAEAEASLRTAEANRANVALRAADVEAARRSVDQAEAALRRAEAGTLTDAARQEDITSALADLRRTQSALDDVRYSFDYTTIVAPRSGVVLEKFVEEGTVIPAGTAALASGTGIVSIADITEMYVTAEVDEVDISRVAVGQPVEIEVETLPNANITGHVDKIFPQGTEEANVVYFQVRIQIDELHPKLRPGMTADVSILIAEATDVLLVPDAAIDRSGGRTVVQVLEQEGAEPVEREIEVGVTDYEQTEVISGLKAGEQVVLPSAASVFGMGGPGGPGAQGGERTAQEERARGVRRTTHIIGRTREGR